MRNHSKTLKEIYRCLYKTFGPQKWWPADTPFEVIIGAILTQNTSWANAERAIKNLKQKKLLTVKAIRNVSVKRLAKLIKPAGYYNQKAKKLKNFIRFLSENYQGNIKTMFNQEAFNLRSKLLKVNGIGPETADSILLYAAGKPVFVIDAYTRRIFSRHSLIGENISYQGLQNYFMNNLKPEVRLFNEYHALIVRLGKQICKTKPNCDICPLKEIKK